MAKPKPAFQMYAAEFFADTATLTQSEVGALVRIMCQAWRHGNQLVSDVEMEEYALGPVTPRLRTHVDREIARLNDLRGEYNALSALRSEVGALGGRPKAIANLKESKSKANRVEVKVEVIDEVKDRVQHERAEVEAVPPDDIADHWQQWMAHRKEIRKPMTLRAQQMQLKQLMAMGISRAIAAIENSIANGYQGIFEPNQNSNGSTAKRPQEHTRDERRTEILRLIAEQHGGDVIG